MRGVCRLLGNTGRRGSLVWEPRRLGLLWEAGLVGSCGGEAASLPWRCLQGYGRSLWEACKPPAERWGK